MKSLKTVTML
uniref:Uncharacterized protein n=1 Tax=Anguilla anguilla TaxID=7936 RepID=A0A0E9USQ7_ANGAN